MENPPSAADKERFALVSEVSDVAEIWLGPHPTDLECHAARELADCIYQITRRQLPIRHGEVTDADAVVLIGTPQTNPAIEQLVAADQVAAAPETPGLDGFVIKTASHSDRSFLILSGSQERSCLYAVYELLERYCHVGYFADQDRVPRAASILLPPLDIRSKPFFEYRQHLGACIWGYSARYWDWDQWKREIDWAARKKFNILFDFTGRQVAYYAALKAFGVGVHEPRNVYKTQASLARRINHYAHSLGLQTVTPGDIGQVPQEFRTKYPNARYIDLYVPGYPIQLCLDPGDPLFVDFMGEVLRQSDTMYGTSHLYNFDPYPESTPGAEPEEKLRLKVDFARSVTKIVRSMGPEAKWIMTGWAFTAEREYWNDEHIRAFLEVIPDDLLLVNDTQAECAPVFNQRQYFFGKNWSFGVLHAFGGTTQLHGDVPRLIRDLQALPGDPYANHCRGFHLTPEIIRHNPLYYDIATRLSWNPTEVSLENWLRDYVVRRYGDEEHERMVQFVGTLIDSVYSRYDFGGPAYHYRLIPEIKQLKLTDEPVPIPHWARGTRKNIVPRTECIPALEKALRIALGAGSVLASETCYQQDVVDVAKELLGNLVTISYLKLTQAFDSCDRAVFKAAVDELRSRMDAVQSVIALCPSYYITAEVQWATRPPYSRPEKEAAYDIYSRYTILFDNFDFYETATDYARKDMFELLKYYYRPRVEALINHLNECFQIGEEASEQTLHERYREICEAVVRETPLEQLPEWLPGPVFLKAISHALSLADVRMP